jgi:hypothetical protein
VKGGSIITYELFLQNIVNPLSGQTVKPVCKSFSGASQLETFTITSVLPFTPVTTTLGLSM